MGRAPMACSIQRRITIHSYRTRLLDHGNLVGGAKPIPDALKHLGWIKDDSPHWVQIDYHQEVDSKQAPLTVVTVEEMGA